MISDDECEAEDVEPEAAIGRQKYVYEYQDLTKKRSRSNINTHGTHQQRA